MPETEDKPDLDELLELLGAPDEEPRRQRIPGSIWLMLALVLSLAGVWLALRTAMGTAAAKTTGPPVLPTKVSDRTPREQKSGTVDVVEDYLARCKKGMTAQEVRWIVEDFQNAGLDRLLRTAPLEDFIRQRKAGHAWYLGLLADGLRLDQGQRREAEAKLVGLFEEAATEFRTKDAEQAGKPFEHNGRYYQIIDGALVKRLIDARQWLTDGRYAPWKLCELTDEQKRLTWHGWIQSVRDAEPGSAMYDPEGSWFDHRMSSYSDPARDAGFIGDYGTGEAPGEITGAGSVFPFVPFQKFSDTPEAEVAGPLEVQAMGCHPSQLKTALLVDPEIAARLLERLDAIGE